MLWGAMSPTLDHGCPRQPPPEGCRWLTWVSICRAQGTVQAQGEPAEMLALLSLCSFITFLMSSLGV